MCLCAYPHGVAAVERERKRKEENDKREKEVRWPSPHTVVARLTTLLGVCVRRCSACQLAERLAAAERVKEAGAAALAQSGGVAGDDDRYSTFTKMIAVGVPLSDVSSGVFEAHVAPRAPWLTVAFSLSSPSFRCAPL